MILRSSTISLLVVLALVLTASGEEWSCPSCPLCTEDEARYLCARYGYAEYCDCVEPEEPPPVNDTGEDEFIFTPDEDREINGTDAMKDMKDAVVPNLMPSGVDGTMTGKPCRFPDSKFYKICPNEPVYIFDLPDSLLRMTENLLYWAIPELPIMDVLNYDKVTYYGNPWNWIEIFLNALRWMMNTIIQIIFILSGLLIIFDRWEEYLNREPDADKYINYALVIFLALALFEEFAVMVFSWFGVII